MGNFSMQLAQMPWPHMHGKCKTCSTVSQHMKHSGMDANQPASCELQFPVDGSSENRTKMARFHRLLMSPLSPSLSHSPPLPSVISSPVVVDLSLHSVRLSHSLPSRSILLTPIRMALSICGNLACVSCCIRYMTWSCIYIYICMCIYMLAPPTA